MRTSDELFSDYRKLIMEAAENIAALMKKHGLSSLNMIVDPDGFGAGDEDFDEDGFNDNKLWIYCQGRHGVADGWMTGFRIGQDGGVVAEALDEDGGEYSDMDVLDCGDLIGLFYWVENYFDKIHPLVLERQAARKDPAGIEQQTNQL